MSFEAEADEKARFHQEMLALGATIGLTAEQMPLIAQDIVAYDCLWIDVRGDPPNFTYSYFYRERGLIDLLAESASKSDVLEQIFAAATQTAAGRFELDHRIPGQDTRRQWFALQADLMARLDSEWGRRTREAQAKFLELHPFDDKT